jgi:hypothetical protein
MNLKNSFITLIFCGSFVSSYVHAQFSFSAFSGSEASGMAGCGAATTGDGALFSNPAGLPELRKAVVALNVENKFLLPSLNHCQIAAALPTSLMVIAAGWSRHGINQGPEQKIWACFGKKTSSRTSLALRISYLSQMAEGYQTWSSWTTELGFQSVVSSSVRVGIYIFHPFGLIQAQSGLESRMKAGFQYRLSDKLSLSADIDKPAWRSWVVRTGLSYSPVPMVTIRAGLAPNLGITSGSISYLWKKNTNISFVVVVHQNLGMSSGVTFVQRFSSNKSKEHRFENSLSDIPLPLPARKR